MAKKILEGNMNGSSIDLKALVEDPKKRQRLEKMLDSMLKSNPDSVESRDGFTIIVRSYSVGHMNYHSESLVQTYEAKGYDLKMRMTDIKSPEKPNCEGTSVYELNFKRRSL